MTTRKLRIGVIGVGFGTVVQIPAFQSEGVEVVAVCARRLNKAEQAAQEFGIPEAFSDYRVMLQKANLDAVSVATPPVYHYEMTMAALEAGKHIICEKPFAMSSKQAREMWKSAEASGLTTMVAHEFRFAPSRAYIKELLEQRYVGDVSTVHMSLFRGPVQKGTPRPMAWGSNKSLGGGFLGALGSHYIDCLRDWCGEITRIGGAVFLHDRNRLDTETGSIVLASADQAFSFIASLKEGGWASFSASSAAPFGPGARITIYGTEGTLESTYSGVNPPPHGIISGARLGEGSALREMPMPRRLRPFDDDRDERMMPFRILVKNFIQGITDGASPSPNFYDGLRCQEILDGIRKSNDEGGWVDIPES